MQRRWRIGPVLRSENVQFSGGKRWDLGGGRGRKEYYISTREEENEMIA